MIHTWNILFYTIHNGRSKIGTILLLSVFIFLSAGCQNEAKPRGSDISDTMAADGTTATSKPDGRQLMSLYDDILMNKTNFYSVDNKSLLYFKDLLQGNVLCNKELNATAWAMTDMDGDGLPEVVLALSAGNEPLFYVILHKTDLSDDVVRGYTVPYRGLLGLKEDGTFVYASGAADNGVARMVFLDDAYEQAVLGSSMSSESNGIFQVAYTIEGKAVTKGVFETFILEQDKKNDVAWSSFSQSDTGHLLS